MTTAAELRELDDDELEGRLSEYRRELLNLRFQLATGQLDNVARLGQVRKDVARVLTVLRDREIALAEGRPVVFEPAFAPAPDRPKRARRARVEEVEEAEELQATEEAEGDAVSEDLLPEEDVAESAPVEDEVLPEQSEPRAEEAEEAAEAAGGAKRTGLRRRRARSQEEE
jgi:large subunit ribosomal protein L29